MSRPFDIRMRSTQRPARLARNAGWAAFALALQVCCPGLAQLNTSVPAELEPVTIEEKLGAQLPLDLEFASDNGRMVRLREFFDGRRPVIFTFNYYNCPMLCGVQLEGVLDVLRQLSWIPGGEFQLVTVSIDPLEQPELARLKKKNYIDALGRPSAAAGWHFLTGRKPEIQALTRTVGFNYRWTGDQWAHSAALILCTPDGRVSRYLGGVSYDPKVLRLSLVEASEGKVGSLWDKLFLWCYHYDPKKGSYAAEAMTLMRLGGGMSVLVLGAGLAVFWRREQSRRNHTAKGLETGEAARGAVTE